MFKNGMMEISGFAHTATTCPMNTCFIVNIHVAPCLAAKMKYRAIANVFFGVVLRESQYLERDRGNKAGNQYVHPFWIPPRKTIIALNVGC